MLTTIISYAQTSVNYCYDDAGNRKHRDILLICSSSKMTSVNSNSKNTPHEETAQLEQKQLVIKDKIDNFEITIYPNPTEGKLSLNVSNMPQNTDNNVKVFDLFGKQLYNSQIGSETTELDLSMQPTGTYIMKVIIADKTAVWKIIKK